jgi:hypothetical protein
MPATPVMAQRQSVLTSAENRLEYTKRVGASPQKIYVLSFDEWPRTVGQAHRHLKRRGNRSTLVRSPQIVSRH